MTQKVPRFQRRRDAPPKDLIPRSQGKTGKLLRDKSTCSENR
jgi:hypothetical protein